MIHAIVDVDILDCKPPQRPLGPEPYTLRLLVASPLVLGLKLALQLAGYILTIWMSYFLRGDAVSPRYVVILSKTSTTKSQQALFPFDYILTSNENATPNYISISLGKIEYILSKMISCSFINRTARQDIKITSFKVKYPNVYAHVHIRSEF